MKTSNLLKIINLDSYPLVLLPEVEWDIKNGEFVDIFGNRLVEIITGYYLGRIYNLKFYTKKDYTIKEIIKHYQYHQNIIMKKRLLSPCYNNVQTIDLSEGGYCFSLKEEIDIFTFDNKE